MTTDMIDLHQRAKAYAKSKGFKEVADDFAQEAYLSLSQGRKAQFKTLLIDFMRDCFGDNRHPNSIKHKVEYHGNAPDTEVVEALSESTLHWDSVVNLLEPQDRLLIVLRYYWGLESKEIAYAMGVSEGRISQKLKLVLAKLKKRIGR